MSSFNLRKIQRYKQKREERVKGDAPYDGDRHLVIERVQARLHIAHAQRSIEKDLLRSRSTDALERQQEIHGKILFVQHQRIARTKDQLLIQQFFRAGFEFRLDCLRSGEPRGIGCGFGVGPVAIPDFAGLIEDHEGGDIKRRQAQLELREAFAAIAAVFAEQAYVLQLLRQFAYNAFAVITKIVL